MSKNKVVKSKMTINNSDTDDNDLQIKVLEYRKIDDTYYNYLILSLTGKDINNVILNTLRRVIIELIPIYAFDPMDITITKNTSIFDNDIMRNRISYMPIFGIDNDINTLKRAAELEYEANISTFEQKIEDLNVIQQKEIEIKAEKSQNFTMTINAHNTLNNIMNVTTDDPSVKFYYKSKIFESPYKRPLLIIKLKPGEQFICTAVSTLNISMKKKNCNYMPNAVCVFGEPNEKRPYYIFNIESLKQLSEKELIIRACMIIDEKLDHFLKIIPTKILEYKSENIMDEYNLETIKDDQKSKESKESNINELSENALEIHHTKGIIEIENETHTFANLITRYIQDHPAINFAGYRIDHPLIKKISIGYKTDGTDIITIMNEAITDAKNIFKRIKTQLEKIDI